MQRCTIDFWYIDLAFSHLAKLTHKFNNLSTYSFGLTIYIIILLINNDTFISS